MKGDGSFDLLWQNALSRYRTQTCAIAKVVVTANSLQLVNMSGIFIIYALFIAVMLAYGTFRLFVVGEATWTEILDLYLYQEVLCYL